jgi:hypothetical protein
LIGSVQNNELMYIAKMRNRVAILLSLNTHNIS